MGDAWLWWLFIQMLGLVCLPLAFSVFANLPDRGWALAKSLGVLGFGFVVWFPLALPAGLSSALGGLALPYSRGMILVLLLALVAFNGWLWRVRWREIVGFMRRQAAYIALSEGLFAGAYALLIWLRSFTPEIYGTEKPMDEAFISAIMRSPHLPPNDPWLSGYSLNYYYLGHFLVATLARLLGTAPAVAFNTAIALVFALMAVNLFGVTSSVAALLRLMRLRRAGERARLNLLAATPFGLAAVLLSLLFGNLFGASQWLAQLGVPVSFETGVGNLLVLALAAACLYGLLWSLAPLAIKIAPKGLRPGSPPSRTGTGRAGQETGATSASISQRRVVFAVTFALALVALAPALSSALHGMSGWLAVAWPKINNWLGHSHLWVNYNWWNPSRALISAPIGTPNAYQNITEFPAFSFVLSDLHAHVLALPFTVLALGVALNRLLARGRGLDAFGETNGWRVLNLLAVAVIIGGLYMLNGWDLPTYAGLVILCLAVQQWRAHGRRMSKRLLQDFLTLVAVGLVLGVILYLPFIRSFSSPSQGVALISPAASTGAGQLIPSSLPAFDRSSVGDFWGIFGVFLTVLGAFLLWQYVLAWLTRWRRAAAERQADSAALGPIDAIMPLVTLTLLALALALFLLAFVPYSQVLVISLLGVIACAALAWRRLNQPGLAFVLMLAGTGLALIAVCEVVYLRDVFGPGELFRMNTVFKLYFQAWTLFSVACGALLSPLLESGWRAAREQSPALERLKGQTAALAAPAPLALAAAGNVSGNPGVPVHRFEAMGASAAGRQDAQPASAAEQEDAGHSYSHEMGKEVSDGTEEQEELPGAPPSLSANGTGGDNARATGDEAGVEADTANGLAGAPGGDEAGASDDEAGTPVGAPNGRPGMPDDAADARPNPVREGGLPGRRPLGAASAASLSARPLTPGLRVLGLSGKLVWMACFLVLVLGALVYPLFAPDARTGQYAQHAGLDGAQYLAQLYPGDAAAIRWINTHIDGDPVIVEATGGEYTDFGMVSTFTGLPTILGWGGHEYQWRVNWLNDPTNAADYNRRAGDLDTIYTSTDSGLVMQLLHQYHAGYLYVGTLEQQKYPKADLSRFAQFLQLVYQAEGVTIYAIP
jgi:uncharacterized membrane protein